MFKVVHGAFHQHCTRIIVLCTLLIVNSDEKSGIESSLFLLMSNEFFNIIVIIKKKEKNLPHHFLSRCSTPRILHRVALLLSHHLHDELGK